MIHAARAAAVLGCAAILSGCYVIESAVPGIPDEARLTEIPLEGGLYCVASPDIEDDGSASGVDIEECYAAGFADAALTLEPVDADEDTVVFTIAGLDRGASLLQAYDEDEEIYVLVTAFLREDGFAIAAAPALTHHTLARGVARDVHFDLDLEDANDLDAEDFDALPPMIIQSGAPDDIFDTIAEATGLWFDRALREEALRNLLLDESAFYVRMEPDELGEDGAEPDEAAAMARVETLRTAIDRAMALE